MPLLKYLAGLAAQIKYFVPIEAYIAAEADLTAHRGKDAAFSKREIRPFAVLLSVTAAFIKSCVRTRFELGGFSIAWDSS